MAKKPPSPPPVVPRTVEDLRISVSPSTITFGETVQVTVHWGADQNPEGVYIGIYNDAGSDQSFWRDDNVDHNTLFPGPFTKRPTRVGRYAYWIRRGRDSPINAYVTVRAPAGYTTDLDYCYRLAGSTPSNPSGGAGIASHDPRYWQRSSALSATSTQNVYRARRTRHFNTSGVFKGASSWGNVELFSGKTTGTTTDTDYCYRRSVSTPATPTGGTTSENNAPTGWQRSSELSATSTEGVYRARRTRTYTGGVFTSATAWGNIDLFRARTTSSSSDVDYIYRRSATTPSTPTGGTTSGTHTPSGWQRSRPTPTETQGVYRARRRLTYTNGVFTSATNWSGVFLVSAKVPTTGIPDSVFSQVDYIYRLSASRPSTPTGGRREENHTPHGWQQFVPSPTSTRSVYRARRFRTYTNQNFTSADQWRQVEFRAASKPVYLGNNLIRRLYYGSTRVVKLYRGSTLIFDDSNG